MEILPYNLSEQDKKSEVTRMFDHIAGKYDLLNHLLSFNVDKYWRKRAIRELSSSAPKTILDLATGTGDMAIAAMQVKPNKIIGLDISGEMLRMAKEKVKKRKMDGKISFILGDGENIPFSDGTFDAVISGFGVRNFADLKKGMTEALRVLNREGQLVVLEFSKPGKSLFGRLYRLYFSKILPGIGGLVSGDHPAYVYLPQSVGAFPDGEHFLEVIREAGFVRCYCKPLTFGIATIYSGFKA